VVLLSRISQIWTKSERQFCEVIFAQTLSCLILSIPSKYSVSEAVGFLKGKSAIKIFDIHHELKKRYRDRHFWAKGYCVSTIGLDEDQIRCYVRHQQHKDRKLDQCKSWNKFDLFRVTIKPPFLVVVIDWCSILISSVQLLSRSSVQLLNNLTVG
jgi:Transposase IS200 like